MVVREGCLAGCDVSSACAEMVHSLAFHGSAGVYRDEFKFCHFLDSLRLRFDAKIAYLLINRNGNAHESASTDIFNGRPMIVAHGNVTIL